MALHRNIFWVGRQWAVTGSGIQACDQKQKGKFDIEASRLWEDGVLESIRALKWLNSEDFEKAVSVARKHYPEPPRKVAPLAPPPAQVVRPRDNVPKNDVPAKVTKEPPKPVVRKFEMRFDGVKAKLIPVWRIRVRAGGRGKNK